MANQSFITGLGEQFLGARKVGREVGRVFRGQPTQAEEISQAELGRFFDESNLRSVVNGAIQAFAIKDPERRQEFLAKRAQTIKNRGGDPRDTLELARKTFAEQNEILDETLRIGEQVGFLKPRARTAEQFTGVTQTPSGPIGIRAGQVELIPQGPGVAEALGKVRGVKELAADVKASDTKFKRAAKIRGEVQKASAEFSKITNSFNRILSTSKDPSAAGDLALIFNFMKMLDPGSVVRESEFATAANAAGIPERIRATYNRALEGERLSPKTRADFVGQSRNIFNSAERLDKSRKSKFVKLAKRFGLEEGDVIVEEGAVETLSDEELLRLLSEVE